MREYVGAWRRSDVVENIFKIAAVVAHTAMWYGTVPTSPTCSLYIEKYLSMCYNHRYKAHWPTATWDKPPQEHKHTEHLTTHKQTTTEDMMKYSNGIFLCSIDE